MIWASWHLISCFLRVVFMIWEYTWWLGTWFILYPQLPKPNIAPVLSHKYTPSIPFPFPSTAHQTIHDYTSSTITNNQPKSTLHTPLLFILLDTTPLDKNFMIIEIYSPWNLYVENENKKELKGRNFNLKSTYLVGFTTQKHIGNTLQFLGQLPKIDSSRLTQKPRCRDFQSRRKRRKLRNQPIKRM